MKNALGGLLLCVVLASSTTNAHPHEIDFRRSTFVTVDDLLNVRGRETEVVAFIHGFYEGHRVMARAFGGGNSTALQVACPDDSLSNSEMGIAVLEWLQQNERVFDEVNTARVALFTALQAVYPCDESKAP